MEKWSVDPGDPDHPTILDAHISFLPNQLLPLCQDLRMIQVAQVLANTIDGNGNQQYVWTDGQSDRNFMETNADPVRDIEPGYFIDHDASKCARGQSCSPYFRDSWPNSNASHDGYVKPAKFYSQPNLIRSTSVADYPVGWDAITQIRLETCVVCQDNGMIYQCVRWGGYRPQWGPLPLKTQIFRPRAAHSPSATFLRALALFDNFY